MTASNEVTLAEVVRKLDAIHDDIKDALRDHEQRLRSVERWVYAIPPTLILAGGSIIAAVIKS